VILSQLHRCPNALHSAQYAIVAGALGMEAVGRSGTFRGPA
jgi:hypothetical protein